MDQVKAWLAPTSVFPLPSWNFSPAQPNIQCARQSTAAMDPPDDDLLIATAAGDRDAFAALYRRRRPDVYRFALHMTGSRAAAEDIAHDVFLVVIRDAHRYQPGRSGVVAWLLGIARNYARRHSAQRTTEPIDGTRRRRERRRRWMRSPAMRRWRVCAWRCRGCRLSIAK